MESIQKQKPEKSLIKKKKTKNTTTHNSKEKNWAFVASWPQIAPPVPWAATVKTQILCDPRCQKSEYKAREAGENLKRNSWQRKNDGSSEMQVLSVISAQIPGCH